MSWGLWDDLTIIDARWLGLSNDATATAFRANTWARGPGAKERPGFVTLQHLRALSGGLSAASLRRVVAELVDAGGPNVVGILEPVEGGFVVHGPRNPLQPPAQADPGAKLSRSEAGRLGGAKSAETRRNLHGSAQPTPKQPPKQPEAPARSTAEARPEAKPEAPRSKPETTVQFASKHPVPVPKQTTDVASNLIRSARAEAPEATAAAASGFASVGDLPSNLEQALELPICQRAEVAVSHPERAEWLQPQKWPEVLRVAEALHEAGGLGEVRLGSWGRDRGVQAVVELFGAGYMPGDLVKACRAVVGDPWWTKDGVKRGLASLSPEVVRRALASGLTPTQEARVARALDRPPSALGSVLPAIAKR